MTETVNEAGTEKWVPEALDQQEAYLADRKGTLHRPISNVNFEIDVDDDRVWCETCGPDKDLRSQGDCELVPVGRCGCPLYRILDNDHLPHE